MDCSKVGNLIYTLRTEKGMTQKALANAMNISDRTISKWERGAGCPDVSLLRELSDILGVNIEKILLGDLEPNKKDGGNMKRIKFYVCPVCGNVISSTGMAEISCCGRKLNALKARPADLSHSVSAKAVEGDYYITLEHDMEKQWEIILCNKQQFVADDICMRWRVRVTVIYGNPYMAYNSRCNPTRRWHASGGRNWDNREAIRRAIEKEWAIKNKN